MTAILTRYKMLYRQKKDTYIRNYDGVGYITSTGIFNDRCTNESGTVFLCALSRKPQTLDELVDKIAPTAKNKQIVLDWRNEKLKAVSK